MITQFKQLFGNIQKHLPTYLFQALESGNMNQNRGHLKREVCVVLFIRSVCQFQ